VNCLKFIISLNIITCLWRKQEWEDCAVLWTGSLFLKRRPGRQFVFNFRIRAGRYEICCLLRCCPAQCGNTYRRLGALIRVYLLICYDDRGSRILWNFTLFRYIIRRHLSGNSELQDNFVYAGLILRELKGWVSKAECERFLVNDQRDAQILFYVFIFIYNSLHVSRISCSSSGETNCINTTSGNCHSVSVAVSSVNDSYRMLYWYNFSLLMMSMICSKRVESYK